MELVLEKFSKSFGPVSVIENLDLTVHSGEMLALLGPSDVESQQHFFQYAEFTE